MRGLDVVLGLAILFVPGELAVELLAELPDVGGCVFEAVKIFGIYGAINAHAGLISSALALLDSLHAGRIVARNPPIVLIGGQRALPQIVSAVV